MINLKSYKRYIVLVVLVFFSAILVSGCSQKAGGNEKKPAPAAEEKTPPPPALKTLLTDLEEVMTDLEKMVLAEKNPSLSVAEQGSDGGGQGQGQSSGQQGGGQGEGGGQEQSGQAGGSSGGNKANAQQQAWMKIEKSLTSIHRDWNMLEAQVMKEGMDTADRDSVEQALARLTSSVDRKDAEESVFAVLDVYKYYPDMVEFFDNKVPADFYRVKYEVMMIYALSSKQDWIIADEHVPPMKTAWDALKKDEKLKSEKDMVKQTENALEDIEMAVNMEDAYLVKIKSSIALDNLKQLEGAFTSRQQS